MRKEASAMPMQQNRLAEYSGNEMRLERNALRFDFDNVNRNK